MDLFNIFLRLFLSNMELPIFGVSILVILILGEINLFSPEVSYQMEPLSSFCKSVLLSITIRLC
jgi:hypothetical protein